MKWTLRDRSPVSARRILAEAGLLFALTFLLAALSWATRSPRMPLKADLDSYTFELDFPLVSVTDALAAYEAGSDLFVDVRPVDFAEAAHIPGAFSIRLEHFDEDLGAVMDFIYPSDSLILYGDDDLQTLAAVAERFRERGYTGIRLMSAGIDGWTEAGGEISEAGDA